MCWRGRRISCSGQTPVKWGALPVPPSQDPQSFSCQKIGQDSVLVNNLSLVVSFVTPPFFLMCGENLLTRIFVVEVSQKYQSTKIEHTIHNIN